MVVNRHCVKRQGHHQPCASREYIRREPAWGTDKESKRVLQVESMGGSGSGRAGKTSLRVSNATHVSFMHMPA